MLVEAELFQDRQRVGGRCGVGNRCAAGDDVEGVAQDVGKDQRREPFAAGQPAQSAPLDSAQLFADGVQLFNVGAGAGKKACDKNFFGQCDFRNRQGGER